MPPKLWYQSKTIWVLLAALVAIWIGFLEEELTLKAAIIATLAKVVLVFIRAVTVGEIKFTRSTPAIMSFCLVGLLLVMSPGCASSPWDDAPPPGMNDAVGAPVKGASGGNASSEASKTEFPLGMPIAWANGSNEGNSVVNAQASPQHSNATAGHVVTGFTLGATISQKAGALAKDPMLAGIVMELNWYIEQEPTPEVVARINELREQYKGYFSDLMATVGSGGSDLDLASLTHLTVVGIIGGSTAMPDPPISEHEAKYRAQQIANTIYATRGMGAILNRDEKPDEDVEAEGE